ALPVDVEECVTDDAEDGRARPAEGGHDGPLPREKRFSNRFLPRPPANGQVPVSPPALHVIGGPRAKEGTRMSDGHGDEGRPDHGTIEEPPISTVDDWLGQQASEDEAVVAPRGPPPPPS